MSKLKVLMTADTVGGVWVYALDLARALAGRGAEVTLATMGGPLAPEARRAAVSIRDVTVHESEYKLEWMDEPWADVDAAGEWLLTRAHSVKPDVVHLNNFAHGALPWRAPVLMVGHSCVHSWWQAVYGQAAPVNWAAYARRVQEGLQAADLVAAPTQAMLDALDLHYGPLRHRQVIYNGREAGSFAPATKEPYIFAVGRLWDEAKNIQALDLAAPAVHWPILAAGQDHHPSGGRQQFAHVRTLGQLNGHDLARWMGRAAIYALPARYEPFGLSVLEAARSGCALVLGDIASLREVWGDAALYVTPNDPAALAATLNRLAGDPALRTRLAEAARQRAMRYSVAAMADHTWRAYQRLLSDGRATERTAEPVRRAASPAVAPTGAPAGVPSLWPQPAFYQPGNLG